MTNPFRKIAPALGIRGLLFSLLGLILLARAVPTLIAMDRTPDIPAVLIGSFLLIAGIMDLISTAQRMTRLRTDKLDLEAIDTAYSGGKSSGHLPQELMSADGNPNEAGQRTLIEWGTRIFHSLAYLPLPYKAALYAALVALSLGLLGAVVMLGLRVVLAGATTGEQLGVIMDWLIFVYFVAGLGFWLALTRSGFRRAIGYKPYLNGKGMGLLFLVIYAGTIVVAFGMANGGTVIRPAPDLGALSGILLLGSIVVILTTLGIVMLRGRRAPDGYSVSRREEFVTVGMHPTDMVHVVKSYTAKLASGGYMHMGNWKPDFAEHTAVSAGEFDADLNAESGITLNENAPTRPEQQVGTLAAWLGVLLTMAAGFMLYGVAGADWISDAAIEALRVPFGLFIFGALLYRLGVIPIAELEWTSVLTNCLINGTFQTQGGMALMQSGDNSIKGSVLTSATVQPRCAYLTSVGFLQPGLAKQTVRRLIDRVEAAEPVGNELLTAIHAQARQMTTIGTPDQPMQLAMPEDPVDDTATDTPDADESRPQAE